MPLIETKGAASAQGFGEFAASSGAVNYIEDVFSTYLYTGNGGAGLTINNGIDLSGKGGLTWLKKRSDVGDNYVYDTVRGAAKAIITNSTAAQTNDSALNGFTSTGFTLAGGASGATYASWTFREQAKFFDVVTYTGNSTSGRTVAHNLGSVPGCIIVKAYSGADASTANWAVYHRSLGNGYWLRLENTGAALATGNLVWTTTAPTSTEFSVGSITEVNKTGNTYVAYLFAHDAGGFGLTGTDNVISCGSFTTDSGGSFSVNLGYEPQWVMIKSTDNTNVSAAQQNWIMMDSMRGFVVQSGNGARLRANTSEAESTTNDFGPTATGFESLGNMSASAPFIYIAIRRGPMKVPTSGTSVFSPNTATSVAGPTFTTNFPVDLGIVRDMRSGQPQYVQDRLRGGTQYLDTTSTAAEGAVSGIYVSNFANNTGWQYNLYGSTALDWTAWNFRRAPSFFDEVCYTGAYSASVDQVVNHNLTVSPELLILKSRSGAGDWAVISSAIGLNKYSILNSTAAADTFQFVSAVTSSTFSLGKIADNYSATGVKYVAYLFATCAGVSKVGSYTGTGTTKQVDCGFAAGARFVLIKRTDSTGDWYVWDSARGIVAGNDPYLLLNSTAAEVTNTDYVDTYSAGFEISSTAPAAINANGGTFIFLAIA